MLESELRNQVVRTMKSWLGYNEADGSHKAIIDLYNARNPLPRGYKVKYTDEWCATTVSAAGIAVSISDIIPPECGCGQQIELFQRMGRWVEADNHEPKPGDVIYYDWNDSGKGDNTGWPEHVGIVEKAFGGNVVVIEGNRHEAVGYRTIPVDGRYIRGYGCPDYKHKAAVLSLYTLARLGIVNSLSYWLKVLDGGSVPHLDDLICKASSALRYPGPRSYTLDDAVDALTRAGIITSGDYWRKQTGNVAELVKALGGSMYA